jgi:hypothetical protein
MWIVLPNTLMANQRDPVYAKIVVSSSCNEAKVAFMYVYVGRSYAMISRLFVASVLIVQISP